MTERAETAEAHIDEVCEVMKERDKLRAELAAMTERAEAGYAAIAKLSSAIGNPCVSSDVSLEMGVVDEAIRRQANAIAERDAALALLREAQFVLDYYGESDISCRIDNLVAGAQP
jgi:hypothetical protein